MTQVHRIVLLIYSSEEIPFSTRGVCEIPWQRALLTSCHFVCSNSSQRHSSPLFIDSPHSIPVSQPSSPSHSHSLGDKHTLDFGSVARGESRQHAIALLNRNPIPVTIRSVETNLVSLQVAKPDAPRAVTGRALLSLEPYERSSDWFARTEIVMDPEEELLLLVKLRLPRSSGA